jgi:hypothetical protein
VVLVRLGGPGVFRVLLPAPKVAAPGLLEDSVVIGGHVPWGLVRPSCAGVELSGVVATSAVTTAVLAFAMQDTPATVQRQAQNEALKHEHQAVQAAGGHPGRRAAILQRIREFFGLA